MEYLQWLVVILTQKPKLMSEGKFSTKSLTPHSPVSLKYVENPTSKGQY